MQVVLTKEYEETEMETCQSEDFILPPKEIIVHLSSNYIKAAIKTLQDFVRFRMIPGDYASKVESQIYNARCNDEIADIMTRVRKVAFN